MFFIFFSVLVIQFERLVQLHVIHIADIMLQNYIAEGEHVEGERKRAEDWALRYLTGNTCYLRCRIAYRNQKKFCLTGMTQTSSTLNQSQVPENEEQSLASAV